MQLGSGLRTLGVKPTMNQRPGLMSGPAHQHGDIMAVLLSVNHVKECTTLNKPIGMGSFMRLIE